MLGLAHGGNFCGQTSATEGGRRPSVRAESTNRTSKGLGSLGLFGALSMGSLRNLKFGFNFEDRILDIYLKPSSSLRMKRGGNPESTYRLSTGDVLYAPVQIRKAVLCTTSNFCSVVWHADP